jgi:hypothetical protein
LDCFPDLKLLADLSHYIVGREFAWPISDENHRLMHRILDNSWAFHGGAGAAALGGLGPIIGCPLFMSMVIITGNVWGFATGEWKQAPLAALRMNLVGVALLIAAIAVISVGSAR